MPVFYVLLWFLRCQNYRISNSITRSEACATENHPPDFAHGSRSLTHLGRICGSGFGLTLMGTRLKWPVQKRSLASPRISWLAESLETILQPPPREWAGAGSWWKGRRSKQRALSAVSPDQGRKSTYGSELVRPEDTSISLLRISPNSSRKMGQFQIIKLISELFEVSLPF